MNLCNKFINSLKKRIFYLSKEVAILDKQIPCCASVEGFNQNYTNLLSRIRDLKATLCDLLTIYINVFEPQKINNNSLKKIIGIHQKCIKKHEFEVLFKELLSHQSSVIAVIGEEYEKVTKNYDETTDAQLRMIYINFPYDFVFKLLNDIDFLTLLIQCCEAYQPKAHSSYVVALFGEIKKYYEKHEKEVKRSYLTADGPLFFSIAEHLIGMLNYEEMMEAQREKIADFQVFEKCSMIAEHGPVSCGLNEDALKKVNKLNSRTETSHFVRETMNKTPALPDEKAQIPGLQHAVYELRKVQIQCCASEMLHCLNNAIQWITNSLISNGQAAGADEIFQFFVFLLSTSKISNVQTLINYMEAYVDQGLRETKYPFLISQMRMALEFIDKRMMTVEPFLIFPFSTPPKRLEKALKLASPDKIVLRGFALYAFPTWMEECESFFPALLYYSGSENDSAAVYKFAVNDGINLFPKNEPVFDSFATLNGTFFQIPEEYARSKGMINVSDGDFESSRNIISCISTMMLMQRNLFTSPCTNDILPIGQKILSSWNKETSDPVLTVTIIVAEMQRALVILGFLPDDFCVDGIFTNKLIEAVKTFTKQNKSAPLELTNKIYSSIISKSLK